MNRGRRAATLALTLTLTGGALAAEPRPAAPRTDVPSFRDMMTLPTPGSGPAPQPAAKPQPAPEAPPDPRADLAYGAYQRGLYIEAFNLAKARAEGPRLNAPAMTLLGELHAKGQGVPRDMKAAVGWYERASDLGDRQAMLELGLLKLRGEDGVERDPKGAVELFQAAGELNQPAALYNLALLKLQGEVTPEDAKGAAADMRAAAKLGEPDAQYAYAVLLKEGRGVEADLDQSVAWLARAAAQDQPAALVEYGIAVFNGKGIPKDEDEAARLFRRAADRGNAIGQNRLARLYAHGRGVTRDPVRAAAWHRMAAAQGLVDTWLEGYVQTLSDADRKAADALYATWSAGFGPEFAAAPAAPSPQAAGKP